MAKHVEIETLEALDRLCETGRDPGGSTPENVVIQNLDLRERSRPLVALSGAGLVLLGCRVEPEALEQLMATGAVVFPALPDLPYRPYRSTLYTPDELMAGYRRGDRASFATDTTDAAIYTRYQASRKEAPLVDALTQRLHDLAVDDALQDWLTRDGDRRVVGIMGGHSMLRTDAAYGDVVRLARTLARAGYTVATGGGPGAMEAGNLGAWLAPHADDALEEALTILSVAPSYRDDPWLDSAYEVRERFEAGAGSLAVPTWFYGHEPTNLFATVVAKYFSNSLREDGLLAIARHGIVFAPGSAGTVQEIFQDAAQNHYGTFGDVSPMVLLDRTYWTETRPVVELLTALSVGRQYGSRIAVVDTPEEAVERIVGWPPVGYLG